MNPLHLLPIATAFVLSLVLTPVVRSIARRRNLVAHPTADRWHQAPTALFGGVAIFISVVIVTLAAGPKTIGFRSILGAGSFLFLIGLIDDLRTIKPYQKLLAQILAATIVIVSGVILPWTPFPLLNMAITVLWLVGITNAVNLLDNMDGLAAGISAIAGAFLTANLFLNGQIAEAVAAGAFVATLLGFLIYNFNPASIFMGDCGSMFLGFFLAGMSMLSLKGGRLQSLPVLFVPVLVLLIPIFDTTLVAIVRRMSGRAVSQGGRDHTSHRLVALGLSERRAVLLLYGLATISGSLGLAVQWFRIDAALAAVTGLTIVLSLIGVYLAKVSVYDATEVAEARRQPLVAFLIDLSYKRRVFEVTMDAALVLLAWHLACMIRPVTAEGGWAALANIAPLLIIVKMPALMVMGVYRGLWRYIGLDSVVTYAKAAAVSSACLTLVLLFMYRFDGFSRAAMLLDGVLVFMFLTGSRVAFRLLRRALPGGDTAFAPPETKRVLIYGAGDGGELLLRELRNNVRWGCRPVGFLDDDPLKVNKVIHGLRVFGGNGSMLKTCEQQKVDEVLISSQDISEGRLLDIFEDCSSAGISVRRMRFQLEPVEPDFSEESTAEETAESRTRDHLRLVPR